MSKYETVIGLEIHAELNTNTKIFCGCKNEFNSEPNANVCPVCMAVPGSLPIPNRAAIEKTILAGLAFGCKINDVAIFERKHYFYPDLPGGYQTSQMQRPICLGGFVDLKSGKRINLNRIHLEEDAGKLVHDEIKGKSYIDLNRGGTPLIEIVTEAEITSAPEATEFLEEVRSRLVFAGVANCKMEEGGMRCDVNLSLRPVGSKTFGKRVEMKNLNSFKMVARAIDYEIKRQTELIENGKIISVETRKWNDTKGTNTPMRTKERAVDYRYFPDPDQPAIRITDEDVRCLKKQLPTLAHEYRERFTTELGLPQYDAEILTREKSLCTFFLDSITLLNEPKKVSNWLLTDILARTINYEILLPPKQFTDVIRLVDGKKITRKTSPDLLDALWNTKNDAEATAKKMGLLNSVDTKELTNLIAALIAENPKAVSDYPTTPEKVINFFMGQIMKQTGGKADSDLTRNLIKNKLADC